MRTKKFSIGGLIGVHVSSIVIEVIRGISSQPIFSYEESLSIKKTRHKQKSTNKTKISKQKTTKSINFAKKTSERRGLFILRFVLITSNTILLP